MGYTVRRSSIESSECAYARGDTAAATGRSTCYGDLD